MNNINTVVLDLQYYNELRDFKENMIKENILYTYGGYHESYITTDVAIKKISVINEELKEEIRKLKNPETVEKTISEIRNMNIFQFLKWKFKK
ncbi:hypothetical protein M0Q50_09045 [bacterium]|nr:hypothetical protein [bacterium]